ncbi:MAG: peptidase domain protein, partial [Caulobacter sp.]|nr:peptidase domain protein [Caulobacter sp.]
VIAALGFTGDSTGPHLHLHVAEAPSPLGGEGAPYAFDAFTLLGRYDDIAALGTRPWTAPAPGLAAVRRDEWPGVNVVVRFAP